MSNTKLDILKIEINQGILLRDTGHSIVVRCMALQKMSRVRKVLRKPKLLQIFFSYHYAVSQTDALQLQKENE